MQYAYEPFVLAKRAGGRIFFVNSNMPFEYFIYCFDCEKPFFLISQLEDGRVAITPNAMCIPWNLLQTGFWPQDLLPLEYEYVTMKHGTYPVIITAHPVANFEEWFRKFERCVEPFAKQTLTDFIRSSFEYVPVKLEAPTEKLRRETTGVVA